MTENFIPTKVLTNKRSRPKLKPLSEEIVLLKAKLKNLEKKQREQQKILREKNQNAVIQFIRSEKLDMVEVSKWKLASQQIKEFLT